MHVSSQNQLIPPQSSELYQIRLKERLNIGNYMTLPKPPHPPVETISNRPISSPTSSSGPSRLARLFQWVQNRRTAVPSPSNPPPNSMDIFAELERQTINALVTNIALQPETIPVSPPASSPVFESISPSLPAAKLHPVLLASPHSGRFYPESFLQQTSLEIQQLRLSEDSHVDRLIMPFVDDGFFILRALFPRAFVDVNRAKDEWPSPSLPADQQHTTSPRAKAGFGVIPTHITQQHALYDNVDLTAEQIKARLRACYHPYHDALRSRLNDIAQKFGLAVLLDMHSMPGPSQGFHDRADIILGDRYGKSCDPSLIAALERRFTQKGYTTVRNQPFAGGYITAHYGRPLNNIHAIQIEINKDLYLDAASLETHDGFAKLQADLHDIIIGTIGEYKNEKA